jgi:predicted GH43/DUF377 family glycosyl hydrolase
MIKIKKHGIILRPSELSFENKAVLNPRIYQDGNNVHMLYRAIDNDGKSCLGYARFEGPEKLVERWEKPFLYPKLKEEKCGIEDPRIVKIEDTFYVTYVVHDGKNALTAYSSGTDFFNLERGGIISPKIKYHEASKIFAFSKLKDEYYFFESFYQEYGGKDILIWHKDVFLFPEKIDDKFVLIQRILPDVQLMNFEDFGELKEKYFWVHYLMELAKNVVLESEQGFELRHVGGGAPPVRTDEGWLMIYHGVQEFNKTRIYRAGAALLDLDDPRKVIARLPYPLFSPEQGYELNGVVDNVVFPTGTAIFDRDLYIYYGAADHYIGLVSMNLDELLGELLKNRR